MTDTYQGCVVLVSPSGRQKLFGRFSDRATYDALVSQAFDQCRVPAIAVHGVVGGREVSREFTPREARAL